MLRSIATTAMALAFVATGCQTKDKFAEHFADEGNRAPALVRGKIMADELGYGLALLIEKPMRDVCTAVFVKAENRRTFLTAAHCLKAFQKGDTLKIARTKLDRDGQPQLQVIGKVQNKEALGKYVYDRNSPLSVYDLAVGIADKDFPADMQPLALVEPDWLPPSSNVPYMFVGAGLIDENLGADNREINKKSADYMDNHLQVRAGEYHSEVRIDRLSTIRKARDIVATGALEEGDQLVMAARDNRDPYVCPGDSGGPLVDVRDNGEKRVAAIFSGAGIKEAAGGFYCWWFPFSAIPVSPHVGWIHDTAKKLAQ